MTLDGAIKHAEEVAEEQDRLCKRYDDASGYSRSHNESIRVADAKWCERCAKEHRQLAEWLKELKQLREQTSWIPLISREPTQEEKDDYFAQHGEELCYMLENEMPLNGQEVLVSCAGYVSEDVFDEDFYNFEGYDIEHVDAWMPKPKAYQAEK